MPSLVAACSQTLTTETSKPVCLIWRGIEYSAMDDTTETIEGIRVNNARRDAYCKGDK